MDILATLTIFANTGASLSWFLQAGRILKNKSSKDVSIGFIVLMFFSLFLFTLYGWREQDYVVFIPLSIGLVGVTTVIIMWVKYRK